MLQLVNTHKKQKKKKRRYSISKESNKFADQLDFTLEEIDIKDKQQKQQKHKERSKNTKTKSTKKRLGTKAITWMVSKKN